MKQYKRMRIECRMGKKEFLRLLRSYYMTEPEWACLYAGYYYPYYRSLLISTKITKSFFYNLKSFILMEKENPFKRTSTANLLSKLQGGKETAEDAKMMAEVLDRRKKLPKDLAHFMSAAEEPKAEKKAKKSKDAKADAPAATTETKKVKKAKAEPAPELSKKEQKAADKAAKKAEKEAGKKKKAKKAKVIVDLETFDAIAKGDHVSFPANAKQKAEFKSDTIEGIVLFLQSGDSGQPYARVAGEFAAEAWKVCNKLTLIARADKVKAKTVTKLMALNAAKKAKAKAKNEAAKADKNAGKDKKGTADANAADAKKEAKKGKKKAKK